MATVNPTTACPQAESLVQVGLQSRILYPSSQEYKTQEESYWSNSAKISPACIVRPQSAEEVVAAVKALVAAKQPFAVRSTGHTNLPGSNNIEGGVTIDLTLINHVIFDASTETVSIGPGQRWRGVYGELQKYGRVVAGGREGGVGVAGLLLGGGNTFFTGRSGMACDHVVSYDIVLADGRLIKVDRDSDHDLWLSLKGGSNNFGIVTNFVMNAIKCDKVWGGM
jgi:FAD/FMN-containing dehydrogenase